MADFDRARFASADEVALERLEIAERLRLLRESHKIAAPERGEHRFGLFCELSVDERRVIAFTELRPLLIDNLDVRSKLLQVLDERLRDVLTVGVVRADRADPLDVPLGDDLGGATPFGRRNRRCAEHIWMQVRRRRELVRLWDRRDEDDLVLLGDRRHGGTFGRRQRADNEVHVILEDELAGNAHRLVGVALGVAEEQFHLAAEHAALGIELLDEHLRTLQGGLAEQRARSRQDDRKTDLDRGLRGCAERDG